MVVTEKLEELIKTKDENHLVSLKEYFFKCVHVTSNEDGEFVVQGLDSEQMQELLTKDYIIECLVAIPGGFTEFLHLIDEFIDPISETLLYILSNYFVDQLDSAVFKELKDELDIGSDTALLALANNVLKKMGKKDISSPKQGYQILNNLLVNMNGNIIKLLMQATLSIHLKLCGSAKMQIQHALKMLLKKLTPYNLQHAVVEKSAIKSKAQQSSRGGTDERWKLNRRLKEEALKRLCEMKASGKFKNNSQASKNLTESLCDYAKQVGCPFSDAFSAQRRIYDWFRAGQ